MICRANQFTGFYMMATLVFNELRFSCYHSLRQSLTGGIMILIFSDFGSRFFMLTLGGGGGGGGGGEILLTLQVVKRPREERA